jgi:hypothetical protein
MLVSSLVLSGIFVALVLAAGAIGARARYGAGLVVAVLGLAFSVLCLMSTPLALNTLLVALVAVICACCGLKRRWFCGGVLAVTVGTYAFLISTFTVPHLQKVQQLQEKYPLESLEPRLAYEAHAAAVTVRDKSTATPEALQRLEQFEKKLDDSVRWNGPRHPLERIHRSQVQHFVDSPGFGVGRMMRNRVEEPRRNPERSEDPIPLPLADYEDPAWVAEYRDPWTPTEAPVAQVPERSAFQGTHFAGVFDFVNREGFGYVRSRREAAGFQAHGFSKLPRLDQVAKPDQAWLVRDVALVSLLKHEQPVVYVSQHLPRMDELRVAGAPVRPLDEVEQRMLAALQRGDDLQVLSTRDRIRMMGSIRAARQCLDCHEGKRGDLLGAFSYKLRRSE